MRIEVEVSQQMEDAIILESLKWHLAFLIDEPIPYSDDDGQEVTDLIAAFKLVQGYYGGT